MSCTCFEWCSRSKHGGRMVLLDETWFSPTQGIYLSEKQIYDLLDILHVIYELDYLLIDYGYAEKLSAVFPWEGGVYSPLYKQSFEWFNRVNPKLHIPKYVTEYDSCIEYICQEYKWREVIVITKYNGTQITLLNGKQFYVWNPDD